MREIPLLKVEMNVPANGARRAAILDYGETIREILFSAPPGRGIGTSDAMKAFEVWQHIAPAARDGSASVLLEEADHKVLLARLEGFAWAFFTEEIAAFVLALREAPEVAVEIARSHAA